MLIKRETKSHDSIQSIDEIFTRLFDTLMLPSNDFKNNKNSKIIETKQFDEISTQYENINLFERYWKSKCFTNIFQTFEKCSREHDLYSIKYAVDNGYHKLTIYNSSIIHYAAEFNNLSLVQDLISCGVDPNTRNSNQRTPLHFACYHNSIDVVKYLLTLHGIDFNAQDSFGDTPLHDACNINHPVAVKLLSEFRGINISIENSTYKTAINMTNKANIHNLFNQKLIIKFNDHFGRI